METKGRGLNLTWWAVGLGIGTALAVATSNWAFFAVGIVIGIALGGFGSGRDGGEAAALGGDGKAFGPDGGDGGGAEASGGGGD